MQLFEIARRPEKISAKFHVRPDTSDHKAIEEVWKKSSYQRKTFKVLPGERWLDLGANVGGFSVFAGARGCTVCAYEPDDDCRSLAQNNIRLNGFNFEVRPQAVVPDTHAGNTISFYVNSRPMALRRHSVFQPKKDFVIKTVPCVRWSDLPLNNYDAVKMNIEGAEIELLEAAKTFGNIKKLVLEYSWDKDPSIARFKKLVAHLGTFFTVVDWNKNLPDGPNWIHYPPNIFIYCQR